MEIVLSPLVIFSSVKKMGILSPCYVSPLSDGLCWPLLASWSTLLSWLHWPTAFLLFPHLCGSSFSISFADSSLLPGYWGPGFLKASTFPFLSRRLCLICPVSASLVFVDVSGSPSKRPARKAQAIRVLQKICENQTEKATTLIFTYLSCLIASSMTELYVRVWVCTHACASWAWDERVC